MQLEHEFVVSASFEETWRFLLDPERVSPCLPGVVLDSVGGNLFAGRWKVKIGPVTVTYRGTARLVRADPETGTLVLEASGKESRGDGTARATARVTVSSAGAGSRVRIVTEINLTGRAGEFERKVVARAEERIFERFGLAAAEDISRHQVEIAETGPADLPQPASPPADSAGSPPSWPVPATAGEPPSAPSPDGSAPPLGSGPEPRPPVQQPVRTAPGTEPAPTRQAAAEPADRADGRRAHRAARAEEELDLFGPVPSRPPILALVLAVVLAGLGLGWRRRRRLRRSEG